MDQAVERLCEGKYLRLLRQGRWEYAQRTNTRAAVGIVAITDQGKLLLVEQPRPAVGVNVIELPAGLVGDDRGHEGEELAQAAHRELLEETGYQARDMRELVRGVPSAGMSDERVILFMARGLTRATTTLGDGSESITLHEVDVPRVAAWLDQRTAEGLMVDLKVYAGLYFAQAVHV